MRNNESKPEDRFTVDEIFAMGFDKYQETFARTPEPMRPEGKKFLAAALSGNRQVPGKGVLEGKVQPGDFD